MSLKDKSNLIIMNNCRTFCKPGAAIIFCFTNFQTATGTGSDIFSASASGFSSR